MKIILTETAIKKAIKEAIETKERRELSSKTCPGLRLRVGSRSQNWILGVRDSSGRLRRYPLGEYPTLGVREAKEAAWLLRAKVKNGEDPIASRSQRRQEARDAREGIGTLNALVDHYGAKEGEKNKSWSDCQRRIRAVFADLLSKPSRSLTIRDLQSAVDNWPSESSAAAAVRYIRPILKWAAAPGRLYAPRELLDLRPPKTVGRRERVLSADELRRILPILRTMATPYHAVMVFLLLTAARLQEVCMATWKDIDLTGGVWRIPETKNGNPHIVPLSRQAKTLLHSWMSTETRSDTLVFPSRNGSPLSNWDRETKAIMRETGTSGWTRHDLRRTAATMMGEISIPPHVIEAALNHANVHTDLATTYNRARYTQEVASALQALADRIDKIVSP